MARNEAKLTKKIKDWLNLQQKSYFFKIAGQASQLTGISDLIGIYHGRFVAIEVKDPANTRGMTARQKLFQERVREAGGIAFEARSLVKVKNWIEDEFPEA